MRQILPASADVLALVSYICSLTTINRTPVASRAAIVIIQKSAFSSTIVPSVVFSFGAFTDGGAKDGPPDVEIVV